MSNMTFREAAFLPILRYADFTGRSGPQEFWSYMVVHILVGCAWFILHDLTIVPWEESALSVAVYGVIILWWILTVVPTLALQVRRLHDQDMRGWWWFVVCIPTLGALILLYWMTRDGTIGPNRFGPDTVAR